MGHVQSHVFLSSFSFIFLIFRGEDRQSAFPSKELFLASKQRIFHSKQAKKSLASNFSSTVDSCDQVFEMRC